MSRLLRLLASDEKSSRCTGTLLRSDNGSQGNTSTFGYLLSQIFREDQNVFHICTTFHCNIHDGSRIVRPCIFHWLKTTIISRSLTAPMSVGNRAFREHSHSEISLRTVMSHTIFSSHHLRDFVHFLCLMKASFLSLMGCKSQF